MSEKFFEFKKIFIDSFPSKNTTGDKFVWNELKWIKVTKNSQIVSYGTSHKTPDERSLSFDLEKFKNMLISKEKYNGLLSLLPFLPAKDAPFYRDLAHV